MLEACKSQRGWGWTWAALAVVFGALASGCAPDVERPSVLLLTLDTTRADRLGAFGHPKAGTRHLDALAQDGALFEWAFTPVPITLPAHTTILTGTYPNRHGVRDNGHRLDPELLTLAEILQQEDYRTAAFISAFPLYASFGLDQGFELYDDDLSPLGGGNRPAHERVAQEVVPAAAAWLEGLGDGERFFLWVHFFDPHNTYVPPPPYAKWYASDPYQGEIAYMDEWIGKLLAQLDASGRAEDTIVVVVADHGEGLGQHGERAHSHLVYNSTMRVPLILRGAGIPAGLRVSSPVSTVDVLPTLLELVGLEVPDRVQGISLTPLLRGAPATSRSLYLESIYPRLHHGWSELQAVVADGWKYIEAPAAGQRGELYELVSDPSEESDRIAEQPELALRLRDQLEALREQASADSAFPPSELSPEERSGLEALGYLTAHVATPDEGARHPRDMMAITDTYVDACQLIGQARLGRALALVEKIERLDPGSFTAHDIRGRYLLARGERDAAHLLGAIEQLSAAVALSPNNAEAWRYLAEAHLALGDWPTALRHFGWAAAVAQPMPDLENAYRQNLADASQRAGELEAAGEYAKALELREVLAELQPEDPAPARRAEDLRDLIGDQIAR